MSCWYEGSPLTVMRMAGVVMTRIKRVWMQDVGREWIWIGIELGGGKWGGVISHTIDQVNSNSTVHFRPLEKPTPVCSRPGLTSRPLDMY